MRMPCWPLLAVGAASVLAVPAMASAQASSDSTFASSAPSAPAPLRREVVFNPAPPEKAKLFFITEFTVSYMPTPGQDPVDDFLFTDSFGLMRNFGGSHAIGGTVDFHLAVGDPRYGLMVRYRRWLDPRQSVDVAGGYVLPDDGSPGMFGPIAYVRYTPTPLFHLQAGVGRLRVYEYTIVPGGAYVSFQQKEKAQGFVGLGFAGIAGVILWGAQLVLFTVFLTIYASGFS